MTTREHPPGGLGPAAHGERPEHGARRVEEAERARDTLATERDALQGFLEAAERRGGGGGAGARGVGGGVHAGLAVTVNPGRLAVGRWQHDVPRDQHHRVELVYAGIVESLRREGCELPGAACETIAVGADQLDALVAEQIEYESSVESAYLQALGGVG